MMQLRNSMAYGPDKVLLRTDICCHQTILYAISVFHATMVSCMEESSAATPLTSVDMSHKCHKTA